jgi:hypothetical protein
MNSGQLVDLPVKSSTGSDRKEKRDSSRFDRCGAVGALLGGLGIDTSLQNQAL